MIRINRNSWYMDLMITAAFLWLAWGISSILRPYTGVENNSALIVCAMTARLKKAAIEAQMREQKTKELFEINARLEKEKGAMELETAKAGIRSSILLSVSHDLRTPLTAISGSASTILAEGEKGCSKENLRLVQDIKSDAEWMAVMAENILLVSMDSLLIQQVLLNLLENAIRHSDSKKPIQIRAERNAEEVIIYVRDYGKGLPASILEQIQRDHPVMVERRGDSSRGMGIGLSVCQSILKAHQSTLQAVLPEDGGTEFYFRLELVNEENQDHETEETAQGQ